MWLKRCEHYVCTHGGSCVSPSTAPSRIIRAKRPTTSAGEAGATAGPSAARPEAPGRPSPPSRFRRKGPASDGQRAYARKLGVRLPEDATNDSANEAIQSAIERKIESKRKGCLATDSSGNSKLKANSRMAAKAQVNRTQDGYNGTHKLAACRSEACKGTERNFKRVELGSTAYWQCPNCEVLHAV